MADHTRIEWTDSTWSPVRGCSLVSAGCQHCYAMAQAHRFTGPGGKYEGLTKITPHGPVWTGRVVTVPAILDQPLHWNRPRRIFVNSMSDLFHDDVPNTFIDSVFGVMLLSPQHTFQILTKRPERMLHYMESGDLLKPVRAVAKLRPKAPMIDMEWPPRNVWLGVSVEDQATADERIPLLLKTHAAVRWISAEPLLGPIDLTRIPHPLMPKTLHVMGGLDWVVVGGESGRNARAMHPDWARMLRDQCVATGVPFLFKQWGAWTPNIDGHGDWFIVDTGGGADLPDFRLPDESSGEVAMREAGKKAAVRMLDGKLWDEYPD